MAEKNPAGAIEGANDMVNEMLNERHMMTGIDYPIAQTLVETLIAGNQKGFIALVDDVKDGMSFEEALQKHYKVDRNGYVEAWKKYISRFK